MQDERRLRLRGLYGMVDLAPGAAAGGVPLARALLDGGARVLQLRMKGQGGGAMLAAAEALRPITRARGALLVVNDRLDVALASGADGVHLGQGDLPLAAARAVARARGADLLIGVSTHDLDQAERAARDGADYLGFGPIFETRTKERPDPVVGLEALRRVCHLPLPVVAIGGITLQTVAEVARAGASAAAIVAAIRLAPDPAAAARAVTNAFAAVRGTH
jgi:thiamine-phosphate pyrophosphorylase